MCLQSPKSDWDSSTMSSSDQRSPFHQTLLEVGAAAGDSQSGSDASHTAAVDIEEPDYAALSTEKLGRIQFSVSYDFDEQTLTVKIIKAEGLAAKDLSGTSDPYVKISLLPDKKHTLSTNIKRKNLNPRWNEVFAFEGKLVIGTLAVDGLAVTYGTAMRGLGGLRPRPVPPRCTKCKSPHINGQRQYNCLCTLKDLVAGHFGMHVTFTLLHIDCNAPAHLYPLLVTNGWRPAAVLGCEKCASVCMSVRESVRR